MNQLPVLNIHKKTLPEAWEASVISTYIQGIDIKTEYDKDTDPPSKSVCMILEVFDPFSEPRIHRCFPGGLEDLEIYKQEVLYGIHDSWIDYKDKHKWQYTYHKRLFDYITNPGQSDEEGFNYGKLTENQINYIVDSLTKCFYTRRAQAITWNVSTDPYLDHPPCLQRIWCQIIGDTLEMHTHWRSRDAYKAAFMNMFALTELQKLIAEKVSKEINREIKVGKYVDITDNYHIYGSYFSEVSDFITSTISRTFEQRTWTTEFAEPIFAEARKKLNL